MPLTKLGFAIFEARQDLKKAKERYKNNPNDLTLREMGRCNLALNNILDRGRAYV